MEALVGVRQRTAHMPEAQTALLPSQASLQRASAGALQAGPGPTNALLLNDDFAEATQVPQVAEQKSTDVAQSPSTLHAVVATGAPPSAFGVDAAVQTGLPSLTMQGPLAHRTAAHASRHTNRPCSLWQVPWLGQTTPLQGSTGKGVPPSAFAVAVAAQTGLPSLIMQGPFAHRTAAHASRHTNRPCSLWQVPWLGQTTPLQGSTGEEAASVQRAWPSLTKQGPVAHRTVAHKSSVPVPGVDPSCREPWPFVATSSPHPNASPEASSAAKTIRFMFIFLRLIVAAAP